MFTKSLNIANINVRFLLMGIACAVLAELTV